MKKVIVIGCPGGGKSTFSKALHRVTEIPLYHLDQMYWNEDRTTVEKEVFLDRLSCVMQQERWILDGNYASTMEMRMQACDTVIFLDYPTEVCLQGVQERRGKRRSDIPWVDNGEKDEEFLRFIQNYRLESRPRVMELRNRYANKEWHVFSTRSQAEEFLFSLQ